MRAQVRTLRGAKRVLDVVSAAAACCLLLLSLVYARLCEPLFSKAPGAPALCLRVFSGAVWAPQSLGRQDRCQAGTTPNGIRSRRAVSRGALASRLRMCLPPYILSRGQVQPRHLLLLLCFCVDGRPRPSLPSLPSPFFPLGSVTSSAPGVARWTCARMDELV